MKLSKSIMATLIALLGLVFKFGSAQKSALAAPEPKPASTLGLTEEQPVYPIQEEDMPDELRSFIDDLVN